MVVVEIKGEIQVSTTCVVPNLLTETPRLRDIANSVATELAIDVAGRDGAGRGGCVPGLCTGPVWYLGCWLSAIGCRLSAIGCRLSARKEAATGTSRRDIGPGTRDPARRGLDGRRIHPPPCRSFVRSGCSLQGSRFSPPVSFSFFLHVLATTTRSLATTPFYEHDLNLSLSTTR